MDWKDVIFTDASSLMRSPWRPSIGDVIGVDGLLILVHLHGEYVSRISESPRRESPWHPLTGSRTVEQASAHHAKIPAESSQWKRCCRAFKVCQPKPQTKARNKSGVEGRSRSATRTHEVGDVVWRVSHTRRFFLPEVIEDGALDSHRVSVSILLCRHVMIWHPQESESEVRR